MSSPEPGPRPSRDLRRGRLIGLLLLGVAAVLLLSSPTWFASGQPWVGVAQLLLALVAAGAGVWLHRRADHRG